jgi:5'-3' exonuclease
MAQPVKNSIIEIHPELSEKQTYTLIVDGTSLLRVSFKDPRVNSDGVHYGGVFQFLLQLKILLQKKDFDYIYVFFDDEDSGILRYQIYKDYKSNRDKNYANKCADISDYMRAYNAKLKSMQDAIFNKNKKNTSQKPLTDEEKLVKENFARERALLMKYFNELYIRWVFDDETEGDDLIAYYIKNKKPSDKVVIVSTDEDLTQLISDTVCIYNPRLKTFVTSKNFKELKGYIHENVVIKKIFCGDISDNIGNIDGLSETRLFELMPEIKDRPITINEVKERASKKVEERKQQKKKPLKWHENIINGVSRRNYEGDFYEINDKIINLSNPLLTNNAKEEMDAIMYAPMDTEGRSFTNLYQFMLDDNIGELINYDRFSTFFSSFKPLADKEIRRYDDFVNYTHPKEDA